MRTPRTPRLERPTRTDGHGEPHLIRVGLHRIRVQVRNPGAGRPLLLLPGIGAPLDLFEPFVAALDAGEPRETISFDPPGVGGSSAPRRVYGMSDYADIAAGVAEAAGHEHLDVLGLSWGGALAQEVALRHEDLVRRLVLVATMHGFTSTPGNPLAMSILSTPWRYYVPAYLRSVAPVLYGGDIRSDPSLLDRQTKLRRENPPSIPGYFAQLGAVSMWSSLNRLDRLHAKTFVLAGDDDPIIAVENAYAMARRLPNATLHIVAGGGHLFLIVRSAETAELVTAFLEED